MCITTYRKKLIEIRRRRTNKSTHVQNFSIAWKKRKVRINLEDTCIECYNTNSQMLVSKMAKNLTQNVTIFCNQCTNKSHFCLPCFNKLH